ncbi:MAG: hypothetical protein ACU0BB_04600 [Paracoccaceae bacterium]
MTTKATLIGTTALFMSSAAAFGAEFELDSHLDNNPKRTGICSMVQAGGALSQDSTLAEACGSKLSVGIAMASTSEIAPVANDAQNIEALATVMQQIRQQQDGVETPAVEQTAVVAAATPAAPKAKDVVTSTAATTYATPTYELSSVLADIRQVVPTGGALPDRLWYVGVYR